MKTYIFKASLLNKPKIYREIDVLETTSLYKLVEAINDAYDFSFDHAFGFFSNVSENRYYDSEKKYELFADLHKEGMDIESVDSGSVEKTKVKDVWRTIGDKMMFLFDYGDCWQFVVELMEFGEKSPNKKISTIIGKSWEIAKAVLNYGKGNQKRGNCYLSDCGQESKN